MWDTPAVSDARNVEIIFLRFSSVGKLGCVSVSCLPILLTAVLRHIPVGCPDWSQALLSFASLVPASGHKLSSKPQEGKRACDEGEGEGGGALR